MSVLWEQPLGRINTVLYLDRESIEMERVESSIPLALELKNRIK